MKIFVKPLTQIKTDVSLIDRTSLVQMGVHIPDRIIYQGEQGEEGKSAYEMWIDAGHTGTVEDFFTYISRGDSAYQTWLNVGNTGSETQFLESLVGTDGVDGMDGLTGESAYSTWLSLGNSGTTSDFIADLRGADGIVGSNGVDGADGLSAYQVWLDAGNTGDEAAFFAAISRGADGKSTYQLWLDAGNIGSLQDFFAYISKGDKGDQGVRGEKGERGLQGNQGIQGLQGIQGNQGIQGLQGQGAYEVWLSLGNTGTKIDFLASIKGDAGIDGINGVDGNNGLSAYDIWLHEGNAGSRAEFIQSLKGEDGIQGLTGEKGETGATGERGLTGADGIDGRDGLSNYSIWQAQGNVGTEEDFLNAYTGVQGEEGASAYQIWQNLGNTGSVDEFLLSLKGDTGSQGDSAYAVWLTITGNESKTREEFITAIGAGDSAYQIWLNNGNSGTEAEFLTAIKGDTGAAGLDGAAGADGANGLNAYEVWLSEGNAGSLTDFYAAIGGGQGSGSIYTGDISDGFYYEGTWKGIYLRHFVEMGTAGNVVGNYWRIRTVNPNNSWEMTPEETADNNEWNAWVRTLSAGDKVVIETVGAREVAAITGKYILLQRRITDPETIEDWGGSSINYGKRKIGIPYQKKIIPYIKENELRIEALENAPSEIEIETSKVNSKIAIDYPDIELGAYRSSGYLVFTLPTATLTALQRAHFELAFPVGSKIIFDMKYSKDYTSSWVTRRNVEITSTSHTENLLVWVTDAYESVYHAYRLHPVAGFLTQEAINKGLDSQLFGDITKVSNGNIAMTIDPANDRFDFNRPIWINGVEVGTGSGGSSMTDAAVKAAYERNSNTNTFTDAYKSKVDGIEAGAQANVGEEFTTALKNKLDALGGSTGGSMSDFEVKSAYERNANTNPFTDNLKLKLEGIESGATGDKSDSEIKAAYERNTDTNVYDDASKLKLDGLQTPNLAAVPSSVGVSITNTAGNNANIPAATATKAGVMTAADKTKLDGLSSGGGGTAMTDAEIKAAYERNANSNEFSDAEQTKLSNIEANATADQTGSEIKSALFSETDTNNFTDVLLAKLNGIQEGATAGGSGGASAFTDLTDTPAALGTAGQIPAVNSAGDGIEFIDAPTGGSGGGSSEKGFDEMVAEGISSSTIWFRPPSSGTMTPQQLVDAGITPNKMIQCYLYNKTNSTLTVDNHTPEVWAAAGLPVGSRFMLNIRKSTTNVTKLDGKFYRNTAMFGSFAGGADPITGIKWSSPSTQGVLSLGFRITAYNPTSTMVQCLHSEMVLPS